MRHRQRHVHKTILEHLRSHLTDLGWFATPAPFSTTPITLKDYEPQQAGETPANNTVAVSMGDQGEDEDYQLGGGMSTCEYVLFVDVYTDSEPIGVALADDIKDAISRQVIDLKDWTTTPATVVDGGEIEFVRVLVEHFPVATSTLDKRAWRSVKATAVCYFGD